MEKNSVIQNDDEFPETHSFVYQGKQYPIKYEYFKLSSEYFQENQRELEHAKTIQFINDKSTLNKLISEDSIKTFIKFVQREPISLSNENVAILNYLGKKYKIKSLIKSTCNYISEHRDEIILDIFTINQNEPDFELETYEEAISNHLEEYFNDHRLLNLQMASLYRIVAKYHGQKEGSLNDDEKRALNEFLFKCLDEFGREASVLFKYFDFGNSRVECMNRLLTEYKDVFDFHFINSDYLATVYEYESILKDEIEEEKRKNKENSIRIQSMKDEIEEERRKNQEASSSIQSMKDEIEEEKRKNKENSISIQNMKDEMEALKKQNDHLTSEISKLYGIIGSIQEEGKRQADEYNHKILELQEQSKKDREIIKQNDEIKNDFKNLVQVELHSIIIEEKWMQYFYSTNIETFNKMGGEMQMSIINEMKMIKKDEKIKKIFNLLSYLKEVQLSMNSSKDISFIFLYKDSNDEEKNTNFLSNVGITSDITEILFKNKKLKSNEFIQKINNFKEFYIQIKYPTSNYDEIYQSVLGLKKSKKNNLKIEIFINGIDKTDSKFQCNAKIESLKIGPTVTIIEGKIAKASYVGSFFDCSLVTKLTIPSSVTLIGSCAFQNCFSIKKVIIPSSVTLIEDGAFNDCESLEQVLFEIPSSVTSFGPSAFGGCKSLVQIKIPSSVSRIESQVFQDCTSLTEISIPSSVTSIGSNCLEGCSSLKKITIPSSIRTDKIGLNSTIEIIKI